MTLLSVKDLNLQFNTDEGRITAVEKVSFELKEGEVLGLVGESGSGKSVTAKALMQLNPENVIYGSKSSINLNMANGMVDVLRLKSPKELVVVRGGGISMIFQEPMASFAPAITIGSPSPSTVHGLGGISSPRMECGSGILRDFIYFRSYWLAHFSKKNSDPPS